MEMFNYEALRLHLFPLQLEFCTYVYMPLAEYVLNELDDQGKLRIVFCLLGNMYKSCVASEGQYLMEKYDIPMNKALNLNVFHTKLAI